MFPGTPCTRWLHVSWYSLYKMFTCFLVHPVQDVYMFPGTPCTNMFTSANLVEHDNVLVEVGGGWVGHLECVLEVGLQLIHLRSPAVSLEVQLIRPHLLLIPHLSNQTFNGIILESESRIVLNRISLSLTLFSLSSADPIKQSLPESDFFYLCARLWKFTL